jgi:hypothetical protein
MQGFSSGTFWHVHGRDQRRDHQPTPMRAQRVENGVLGRTDFLALQRWPLRPFSTERQASRISGGTLIIPTLSQLSPPPEPVLGHCRYNQEVGIVEVAHRPEIEPSSRACKADTGTRYSHNVLLITWSDASAGVPSFALSVGLAELWRGGDLLSGHYGHPGQDAHQGPRGPDL